MFNLEDYEDVQSRVERFKKLHPVGRIVTDVIQFDADKGNILIAAQVYREHEDTLPAAVDYAFGNRDTYNPSMRRFYVEDTVSSAIGRALALVLPSTPKKPTKQDMAKVEQAQSKPDTPRIQRFDKETIKVENANDPWTVKEVPMSEPAANAVELVKEVLGGEDVKPPAPNCKCGSPMKWYTGTSQTGKPWAHYRCGNVPSRRCQEPIWYEIAPNGTWQAQKVKA